jgi:hypothetical protein
MRPRARLRTSSKAQRRQPKRNLRRSVAHHPRPPQQPMLVPPACSRPSSGWRIREDHKRRKFPIGSLRTVPSRKAQTAPERVDLTVPSPIAIRVFPALRSSPVKFQIAAAADSTSDQSTGLAFLPSKCSSPFLKSDEVTRCTAGLPRSSAPG